MKLLVRVEEARNLPAMDVNGDTFVKLKMGRQKYKTKGRVKSLNPCWGEEFCFKVEDLNGEIAVSVLREDKFLKDDFVGQLKVPVFIIFESESKSLGTAWYSLRPKSKKSKHKDCGEILLTICFSQNSSCMDSQSTGNVSKRFSDTPIQTPSRTPTMTPSRSRSLSRNSLSQTSSEDVGSCMEDKAASQKSLAGRIAQIFNKNGDSSLSIASRSFEMSDSEPAKNDNEDNKSDEQSTVSFEDAMRTMEVRDPETEMPSNLPGGILVDQLYMIAPRDLNSLLWSNDSEFPKTLADIQETTDLIVGPWKFENGEDSLKRILTYGKPASKLIKAVKVTEELTYLKADGKHFAVLASVSIPDVPYGNTFRTEILYCITPGPELLSGEECSHLVISWRLNFIQSTMMKGMIESGARQGLKESFGQFTDFLSQKVKVVDSRDTASNQEQLLASLQGEPQSDWKLAVQYLLNITVASTIILGIYVMSHIWIAMPGTIHGLEFVGIDLPDSIGEFVVSGILVLQGKRVLKMLARFMQARAQKSTDHGVKAQGDGWLLTVALVEGSNVGVVDASGVSDPYVVFTCNGRTRTSSIKFQKENPVWNEIFEFDAMGEPPSMMLVEVIDFAGPFDGATSLGHAEINFIKSNLCDLADFWIPLEGKLALASQAKLHLRIFLNNSRGNTSVKEYLTKMEKEVGKKLNMRSPQTNSAFQKLFGLPPEEFLINDFTCHLKRRMPLQVPNS
uniref:C2 and GRAM domain-containing protein n=1 Tax=Kalanchoe fedtschenkoi TaxID=63787 RepID=A0A7N0UJP1_KALFE